MARCNDYGALANWDWRVKGQDRPMTDACQFDESDANYLARRWAAAGLCYWFEHDANGHRLVLADDTSLAEPIDGDPDVPFQRHGGATEEDGIGDWSPVRHLVHGSVAVSSYDFKSGRPVVTSAATLNQQGAVPVIESYEYTGAFGFRNLADGDALARLRMEETEARGKLFEGGGNNRQLMPGRWFRLTGHFDADGGDEANEFLVVECTHHATNNYQTDSGAAQYHNRVSCLRRKIPWRPGRGFHCTETKIYGIQTATVVGPKGEEIHTDEFGRVRVQFHWDREGQGDERSSAWIRVATPWAGANTAGYLASVTDALGNHTRFERLPTGEPVRVLLPDGTVQESAFDAAGLLIAQRYGPSEGRWLRNARGQVVEATDAAGRRLVYRYDPRGRLTALSTDAATGYAFDYDAGDRLVREVRPDGVERRLRYDAAGELVELVKLGAPDARERARRTTLFERDDMGRLLAQRTATSIGTYTWNDADRLVAARRDPTELGAVLGVTASSVMFDYDQAGRLVAEHGAEGTVVYGLDELDNIASLALPHGQRIDLLSYGSGHVHQIRAGDRVISDVERDDLHREILRTQGRLVQRTGYDPLGRRLWQAAGMRADALGPGQGRFWRTYRYDRLGELAAQHDNVRGRIDYQYDPAGHLLRQNRGDDVVPERFVWDAAGNLLDRAPDGSQGRVEGYRLKVWRDIRFEYDAWGNVSQKRKGTRQSQRFTFDAEDRLVAVTTEDAQGTVETRFDYDPLGRRIASSEIRRDPFGSRREQCKRFVWQGLRMVQEVREGSVSSYVYSPDSPYTPLARLDAVIGGVLAQIGIDRARETARIFHFHTDPVGTPLELTDEAGELAWAGKYTAWGRVERGEDAALLERTEQPLRYPGQYADGGTGLHYNTFRYYDPDVGRYVSQDPIGLLGGANIYAYPTNPTGDMDPLGWCSTRLGERMGARRGDGMANHHLIPEEVLKNERFSAMFKRLKSMGFDGDRDPTGSSFPGVSSWRRC